MLWLDYKIKIRARFYELIYILFFGKKIDSVLLIYKLQIISHEKLN